MKLRRQPFTEFCERVLRLTLTRGQRVLCGVAFDGRDPGSFEGADRELALEMFGGAVDVPALARRVVVLTLGRGSGKTTLAAAYGLWRMLTADVSRCGPGDVPHVVVIAPRRETAALAVGMALELAKGSPALARAVDSETSDGFTLRRHDGRLVAFAAFSASRGGASARGLSILSFVLDEAQFFQSESEFVVNDRDVFSAIIPRLLPGGAGVFISTPWPVPTLMSELHERNFGAPATALAALATTLTMRDGDPELAATIEAERLRDPENAAREFDGDASMSGGSAVFFDPEAIKGSVDEGLVMEPRRGLPVFFGADLGFVRDSSALVGGVLESARVELVAVEEMRPTRGHPLRPKTVVDEFATVIKTHGGLSFLADAHYQESAKEHLEPHGIAFEPAPGGRDGKGQVYLAAKKLLHEGRARVPNHPRLLAQLRNVISKPAPGGGLIIQSPRRTGIGHGDIASAFALCLWAATQQPSWIQAMANEMSRTGGGRAGFFAGADDASGKPSSEPPEIRMWIGSGGERHAVSTAPGHDDVARWDPKVREIPDSAFGPRATDDFRRRVRGLWARS